VAVFFRGGRSQQRTTPVGAGGFGNLQAFIDEATGGRRGIRTGAARPVGWSGALSIPAVWAAVRLRANIISSLPVLVMRDGPDGLPQQVASYSVPPVLSRPSATFDMVSWLHASQMSLDLRGNAYGKIVARDPRTFLPSQIELVHPDDVQVRTRVDGSVEYRMGGKIVDAADVWHETQNEQPGAVTGMSPIAAAARALGVNLSAADYGGEFYEDAMTASGVFSSEAPIDEVQAKIAKARIMAVQSGREPLVLGGNWTYRPLTVAPAEAMFLDVLRFGAADVARLFDVPGEMIEANTSGSSVTYANREQRSQDLLAFRLGPAIARRERALTRLTVRGQYVKLNTAALLRGDLMTRYKSYQIGLQYGFLALDEVRALEDREPMTADALAQLADIGVLGKGTPATTAETDEQPAAGAAPTPTGATNP
jgi:HK97 family phage portal protein